MDVMVAGLLVVLLMAISLHPSRFENWMTGESSSSALLDVLLRK
jgi:hypothetical protein